MYDNRIAFWLYEKYAYLAIPIIKCKLAMKIHILKVCFHDDAYEFMKCANAVAIKNKCANVACFKLQGYEFACTQVKAKLL